MGGKRSPSGSGLLYSISQALLGHIPWLLTSFSSVLTILPRFVLVWVFPRAEGGPTALLGREPCHGAARHSSLP